MLPTLAVFMLSVFWKTKGKYRMPPIRPGQLSWFAVTTVLGVVVCMLLGRTLGAGPVSVKMTGCWVTCVITRGDRILGLDRFRNRLVFLTIRLRACRLAVRVQVVPRGATLLVWLARISLRTLYSYMPLCCIFSPSSTPR